MTSAVDGGPVRARAGWAWLAVVGLLLLLATLAPAPAHAQTGICGRTEAVHAALVAQISGVSDCALVTGAHLAAVSSLRILGSSIALEVRDFAGLTSLTNLHLYSNGLTELPAGVFAGLTSLTNLHLYRNALTSLPARVFDGLTSLTNLDLGFNALTELPAGVFDGLTSLTNLDLHNNELTELPAGVFAGLTSLTELDLYDNGLTSLPAGVFNGLTSLTNLDLYNNELTELPAGVFDGLTTLTELSLPNTNLTTLPAEVFNGLTSLTVLHLGSNELTELPAGVFDGLTSLTVLTLPNTNLTTLPAGVFDELTSLTELQLHNNALPAELPAGVFAGLTKLTKLLLEENPGAPFAPEAVALPDDGTVLPAGGTVTLDGSDDGGPWGTNVTYGWALTNPASGVTVTFDNNASAKPVVTIPALTEDTELTFTLTVTGRGGTNGIAPATDTAKVTVTATANTAPTATDATVSTDEDTAYDRDINGSIPAWAGKPFAADAPGRWSTVYPRVGGETLVAVILISYPYGLSPRGRGNQGYGRGAALGMRSIPAWAGKPLREPARDDCREVYPRVGGETVGALGQRLLDKGLSPRGRGNLLRAQRTVPAVGSIPAWAGKPLVIRNHLMKEMVYPRVGGETPGYS